MKLIFQFNVALQFFFRDFFFALIILVIFNLLKFSFGFTRLERELSVYARFILCDVNS